jgi:hypothetical protein
MNVIPFVFTILLILSYGMAASFQGRLLSHRNQKAYVSLCKAELQILRQSEKEQFKSLPGDLVKKEKKPQQNQTKNSIKVKLPEVNLPCAKLNLYPLLTEGQSAHPALYETAAKMLRTFYQNPLFKTEKRFEYKILDAILAGGKIKIDAKNSLALETIALSDPTLQPFYYAFLKGTKRYQLSEIGYPPLVDYWKIEKDPAKICLFHCNPDMLTIFFGVKTAPKLHDELRDESKKAGMSLEAILEWATDPQLRFVDKEVWELIDFKRPQHGSALQQTMLAEEDGVLIRKDVSLKSKSRKS